MGKSPGSAEPPSLRKRAWDGGGGASRMPRPTGERGTAARRGRRALRGNYAPDFKRHFYYAKHKSDYLYSFTAYITFSLTRGKMVFQQ